MVISKCPEEYTGPKSIEMPEEGGSLGREAGCTVPLVDHKRFISGTHCLLSLYGDTYYISDVSTNGTLVNGNKILKNQPVSLFDGDRISLGQYEVSVSLELITTSYDIASEIEPERDSTDPLVNLEELAVEEEVDTGTLEELFMETKPDGVDNHDPVDHLNFSMQREDDYLVRDEAENQNSLTSAMDTKKQVVDDSLSIHSEFDLPNLIPEDWMGLDDDQHLASAVNVSPVQKEVSTNKTLEKDIGLAAGHDLKIKSEMISDKRTAPTNSPTPLQPAVNFPSSAKQQVHKWEDVTQEFVPHLESQEPSLESLKRSLDDLTLSEPVSESLTHAFFEGLGAELDTDSNYDALFFKQMGACLRLCMDNLYKHLQGVEELTEENSFAQNDLSLTTLMLTLNSQNLLAPNELIEQILDELDEHEVLYAKTVSEIIYEQLKANDPKQFEATQLKDTRFLSKSKLWKKYGEHYEHNTRIYNDSTFKALIKDRYNKVAKADHA
tara:strand:- start:790 stop:2274 length:1485 start_codon:yes stop_codon:yes gene_type:complete